MNTTPSPVREPVLVYSSTWERATAHTVQAPGDANGDGVRVELPRTLSADNTAAVRFPCLLVEHLRLSAQIIRSVHEFIQPDPSLQHAVDRSVLGHHATR